MEDIKNSKNFDIEIIQPPMVQLNTPYPSGAYLKSFFQSEFKNLNVVWHDFSNELFHKIFCRDGLSLIFSQSEKKALKLAESFENNGDDYSAFQIRRFISESEKWISWIDKIVSMVCQKSSSGESSGRESVHEFIRSAHSPRGMRVEHFLENLGREVSADDCQIIATLSLADLTDFISTVYDKNFSLIQYAQKMAASQKTFIDIEENLNSPVLKEFYTKILQEKFPENQKQEQKIFLITIPFAGCFEAAVFTGKFLKSLYGENCIVVFGGGFVNCELRDIQEERLFKYADLLSFDKGFGSYKILLEILLKKSEQNDFRPLQQLFQQNAVGNSFYKIRYFSNAQNKIIPQKEHDKESEEAEHKILRTLVPDYSEIDFKKYPKLSDDKNPMHRIWNDGSWLKVFLAYGCYWHKCAFCDTNLDYVKDYCPVNLQKIFDGIYEQAEKTGIYGLHFVDEACPPKYLKEFVILNCRKKIEGKKSLTFWGNIRFEKTFSRDFADLLSYGGMTAVSAGIEIATGCGLQSVNKGTNLEAIVQACCAFKEAGILVHSYMIFGFWNQSEQDLIDSMETLRQMFQNSLLDSAFFHKFSLTKNSTVYREWKSGKIKGLQPIENPKNAISQNEISFKGEEKSYKYAESLNIALENWMHGEKIEKSVQSWFNFKMPSPSISKDFVLKLVEKYEKRRDEEYFQIFPESESFNKKKFVWLGGKILILKTEICWTFMGEMFYFPRPENSQKIAEFLDSIKPEKSSAQFSEVYSILGKKLFLKLRPSGLCCIDF